MAHLLLTAWSNAAVGFSFSFGGFCRGIHANGHSCREYLPVRVFGRQLEIRYSKYVAVVEGLLTSHLRADDQRGVYADDPRFEGFGGLLSQAR